MRLTAALGAIGSAAIGHIASRLWDQGDHIGLTVLGLVVVCWFGVLTRLMKLDLRP